MNKDFVTYEIAKKMKDNGFKEKCLYNYRNNGRLTPNYVHPINGEFVSDGAYGCCNDFFTDYTCDAPTIFQTLKWLIKERGIFVEISPAYIDITYYVSVYKNKDGRYLKHYISELKYKSYEQAAIAGIEYVLDNIIKEQP